MKQKGRLLILACALLLNAAAVSAQVPDVTWSRLYGGENDERIYALDKNGDGYIIAGKTTSFGGGNADMYILKTDANGDSLWMTVWGTSRQEHAHDVITCSSGGYAVVGIERIVQNSYPQVVFHRLNSSGAIIGTRTYGHIGSDDGWSINETGDGGFVMAGRTDVSNTNNDDVYLIRTDTNGDTLWTRTYGGDDHDEGYHAEQTLDGGFIITGGTSSPSGGSEWDVYLIRTDAIGDTLWTRYYGGPNYEMGYYVQQTLDGGFVIAGETNSYGAGNSDFYLVKTDASGDTLWTRTYGGYHNDVARSVQYVNNGYIIIGHSLSFGATDEDMYIVRINLLGDTLWTKVIGGDGQDFGYDIEPTSDGGYIATGYTNSWSSNNLAWLVKLDADATGAQGRAPEARLIVGNHPNPFNPTTLITYRLPEAGHVTVSVYDAAGRTVAVLYDGVQSAKEHVLQWNAAGLPSGVYFVRLEALGQSYTVKSVLLK